MATAVKTKVTELPESRVRVEAEVPADEVERSIQKTARTLGANLRIPGFRKGKVPPPVVIRRIGRDAVLDETVRDAIGRWYVDAIGDAKIAPVGDPKLDLGDMPDEGQPLTFSIEIGVRPRAQLGDYVGIEVGRREPAVDDAAVDAELEALRERAARLEPADRAAQQGDFVVMDYEGRLGDEAFEGGSGRDQMIELGSGRLIPGFEDQLQGAAAGDEREVKLTFPADYQAEHLAGQDATFAVTVKEVREKVLPALDDDFALEQAGFDSLDELKQDVRTKLRETDERRIEQAFREAVIAAVIDQEKLEASDGDVLDALQASAARENTKPEKLRDRLEQAGRLDELKADLAQRMAVDWLVERAKPISVEQAQARDKLWTPEKSAGEPAGGRLWTPGA